MANRRRYKELETLLTRVLLADVAVFVLYLIFAGVGVTAMKVITAIIAILASGLCLALLYTNGEMKKRRSRWLVCGFAAIVICLLVSLVVKYPSPKPEALAGTDGSTTSTSASAETDASAGTDVPTETPTETGAAA